MDQINFNQELVAHSSALKSFAYRFTTNGEDANDLLQETFVKAISYRDKFAENTNFKAWLFTIMRNTFINNYRKSKRANTVLDNSDEDYFLNFNQPQNSERSDQAIHLQEVIGKIEALTDDYRIPFQMHYNGFKYEEIANELHIPVGTVKSRIFLARKKLMSELKDHRV